MQASAAGAGGGSVPLSERNVAFTHAIAFVAGFSVVFLVLGASVGFISSYVRDQVPTLTRVGGVLVILFGLQVAGLLKSPTLRGP